MKIKNKIAVFLTALVMTLSFGSVAMAADTPPKGMVSHGEAIKKYGAKGAVTETITVEVNGQFYSNKSKIATFDKNVNDLVTYEESLSGDRRAPNSEGINPDALYYKVAEFDGKAGTIDVSLSVPGNEVGDVYYFVNGSPYGETDTIQAKTGAAKGYLELPEDGKVQIKVEIHKLTTQTVAAQNGEGNTALAIPSKNRDPKAVQNTFIGISEAEKAGLLSQRETHVFKVGSKTKSNEVIVFERRSEFKCSTPYYEDTNGTIWKNGLVRFEGQEGIYSWTCEVFDSTGDSAGVSAKMRDDSLRFSAVNDVEAETIKENGEVSITKPELQFLDGGRVAMTAFMPKGKTRIRLKVNARLDDVDPSEIEALEGSGEPQPSPQQ